MTEAVIFLLLGIAAYFDWKCRKIPNTVTFPALAAGLVYQWQAGMGWTAVAGVAGAFLLTVVPVVLRGMGMGDQKLLMAVGAWVGWSGVYPLFLHSFWVCLAVVVFLPGTWRRLGRNMHAIFAGWVAHRKIWLPRNKEAALSFPYAVPLLGAYLVQHLWR
ncbi:A24 family peptidase [Brevibacillus borstelensis]|uniref:A24 family peptidase n=1 Tax=Brevibacillus borstelensis TaxID=45462 RepID=UPI0030CFB039